MFSIYNELLFDCGKKRNHQIFLVKLKINALMKFAYCSANLRDVSWHFQWHIMDKMFEILLGLSQPAKDEISFCEMKRHNSRSPRRSMGKISHFGNQINSTYLYIIVKVIHYYIWIHNWNLLAGSNLYANKVIMILFEIFLFFEI